MPQNNSVLNEDKVLDGFVWGVIIGAVMALVRGPRIRFGDPRGKINDAADSLRDAIESVTPTDPLEAGIEEGKKAAHRRQSALSLDTPDGD